MLLAIDIGNTNIKLALFKGERLLRTWRLVTDKSSTLKQYKGRLQRLFARQQIKPADISDIIICSVVPRLTAVFKKALSLLFKQRPLILGRDIIAPIKNLYRKPEQVGQDRLANAVAAVSKYGSPLIIVDFGTALTFDLVSAKGSYLGGIIVPGMETSLKTLIKSADLLPKISLARPKTLLGRDTTSSMKSGLIYGYSFLVEGVLQQLKKGLKPKPCVIATGGAASLMIDYCKSINIIDENLTLEGLQAALKKRKQAKELNKER